MRAEDFLKKTQIMFSVSSKRYNISEEPNPSDIRSIFAIVNHAGIFTVIREGNAAKSGSHILITFETDLPSDLTGFLAMVSKALGDEEVPIFAISSFRTDHILVRKAHRAKAVRALVALGFRERMT